jgi:hypothetical protein
VQVGDVLPIRWRGFYCITTVREPFQPTGHGLAPG